MKIITVDPKGKELEEFAKSFNHPYNTNLRTYVAVNDNDEWLGFLQFIDLPTTISAWKKPGVETIKAIKLMKNTVAKECGGAALTGCASDSPFYPHMERLGFTKANLELYFTVDESI
jgi:hypothetical protein